MSEVLLTWIRRRLGASLEFNIDTIGQHFFDGKLYFKILQSYNIVLEKASKTLVTAYNSETALKNLNQLCFWLKLLGVSYTKKTIKEVSEGNASACLRLLFALYICLENKETWYFVTRKNVDQMLRHPEVGDGDKFRVERACEMLPQQPPKEDESPYAIPLYESRKSVEKYRQKQYEIIRNCKLESQKRREILAQLEEQEEKKRAFHACGEIVEDDQNEVCCNQKEIKQFSESLPQRKDEVVECTPEEYVSLLKVIKRKVNANKELTAKMHSALLKEVWAKILEDQEKKFNEEFTARLAQQSQFEKQMCLRIERIHRQNKVFVENKRALQRLAEVYQASANYFDDTYVVLKCEEDYETRTEKLRVALLHRKLYAQKMRQRAQRHCKLCHEIAEDLADFAVKISETETEQGSPVSRKVMNEWKALFYKSLPLFLTENEEIILARSLRKQELSFMYGGEGDVEGIRESEELAGDDSYFDFGSSLSTYLEEEEYQDYDFLIRLDLEAVDEVNEQNLEDYLYMLGPWRYEIWPDLGEPNYMENVLGFVVHRLLEFKYPLPLPPEPPDLPDYSTKVVLNNLNDKSVVDKLKMLLGKSAVAVVDVPTALNYCIEEYVKYADPEEIKIFLEKREKAMKKGSKKSSKKSSKAESSKEGSKKSSKAESSKKSSKKGASKGKSSKPPPEPPFKDIQTQVPSFIEPDAPRILSQAEILGRMAVEALNSGQPADNIVLIKCLIEYLKSLEGINGWVLVNYPQVCSQIELLEFIMTAIMVPVVCSSAGSEIKLYIDQQMNLPVDKELLKSRSSKLVPRTTPEAPSPVFFPYFHLFINLQNKKEADKLAKQRAAMDKIKSAHLTDDSDDEEVHDLPILMEDSTPESFYDGYGIYKNFVYTSFDFTTLKELARTILGLGEVELEMRVPSEVIFGEAVLKALKPKKGKKTSKKGSAKSSKKTATTKSSKGKTPKEKTSKKKKGHQAIAAVEVVPVVEEIVPEEEEIQTEPVQPLEIVIPKPGDPDWVYSEMPIHDELQIILASIWESIESTYLDSMKQIFFMCRVQNSVVIPYRNYLRTTMEEIIQRPDNRQEYVTGFQEFLNNIPEGIQHKTRVKAELHCRVFELQEKLCELSDLRKDTSEGERRKFIAQNWLAVQLTILANVYICMLQVEADRFIDTLQLLYDYHTGSLALIPEAKRLEKLEIIRLKRVTVTTPQVSEESTVSNKSKRNSKKSIGSSQIRSSKKSSFEEPPHASIMELLSNVNAETNRETSIHTAFTEIANRLYQQVTAVSKLLMDKASHVLKPTPAKGKKKKAGSKGASKSSKKKKTATSTVVTFEEPPDPKQRLFDEWVSAVEGETNRTMYRIKLIIKRCLADLTEVQSILQTNFHGLYNEIVNVYRRDLSNIAALCSLLRTAIEDETPIQQQLILGMDKFRADPNSLMFEDPPPPPPTELQELGDDYFFTVAQLYNLLSALKRASPVGIVKEAFLDILEDMALFGCENGYPHLPKSWSQLNRIDLRFLLDCAFGDALIIDWRDFLVFAMNLPYPTAEEVVEARQKFLSKDPDCTELVSKADFEDVLLWFEKYLAKTLEEDLRHALIKQLLFDMFNVGNDMVNYTALLLAFCRDEDPVEGFGKALALASGTGVVLRQELMYLTENEDEKRRREAVLIAEQIELQILTDVMQYAEGVVIHEIEEEAAEPEFGGEDEMAEEEEMAYGRFGEEYLMEMEEGGKFEMKWVTLVSYELALTVLLAAMHFYALSIEQADYQLALEKGLEDTFKMKGDSQGVHLYISGFALADSHFLSQLLSRVYLFKACNVVTLAHGLFIARFGADSSTLLANNKL